VSIRNAGEIASDAVKAALKAERARVRRLVRKLRDRYLIPRTVYQEACDDILNALKDGR